MTEWHIRLARIEDADRLPAIERAASRMFSGIEGLEALAEMNPVPAERHRAMIRQGHSLVAHCEARIVGFLSAERYGPELHVRELSVHPEFQRRRIATILLRAIEIDARNAGFSAITLTSFADVAWNAPFYARHGFVLVEDLAAHPRLRAELDDDARHGLPPARRCAMIKPVG